MMKSSIEMKRWGLSSKPNFGDIDFKDEVSICDLVSNNSDLLRVNSQIIASNHLKKSSLNCIVGSAGKGKSVLSRNLAHKFKNYEVIDFSQEVELFQSQSKLSMMLWEICDKLADRILPFKGELLSDILGKTGYVRNLSDDGQFILYLIKEFSLYCENFDHSKNADRVFILDNLDHLSVFQFRYVLNLFGQLSYSIPSLNFCINLSPAIYSAMTQSDYRGEATDIVPIDTRGNLDISTDSVINKRFRNKSIGVYDGAKMLDFGSYSMVESIGDKREALNILNDIFDYAEENNIYSEKSIPYDLFIRILSNNNIKFYMKNKEIKKLEMGALKKDFQSMGISDQKIEELTQLLEQSDTFKEYLDTRQKVENSIFEAILDFR